MLKASNHLIFPPTCLYLNKHSAFSLEAWGWLVLQVMTFPQV